MCFLFFFFFQAEDGIRDLTVTGVQTCALPILLEVTGHTLTFTPQDGKDDSPSYYTGSYPRALRDAYQQQWHRDHDPKPGAAVPFAETVSYTRPEPDLTRADLRDAFEAVRHREAW